MALNKNLTNARSGKRDEFYTGKDDVEDELDRYADQFMGKSVLCPCGDGMDSEFFLYFLRRFNSLHLARLVSISYQSEPDGKGYVMDIRYVPDMFSPTSSVFYFSENKRIVLNGDGDFRSGECLEYIKKSDIVCTNPPFSLFRDLVKILTDYGVSYLLIGNMNAVTYKEIFPLRRDGRMWLGYRFNKRRNGKNMLFRVPDDYDAHGTESVTDENGQKLVAVPGTAWFTNLDVSARHEPLLLTKHYDPEIYPKYDKYDAINVNRTMDIPVDYKGVMGVPITWLDRQCLKQFEIIGDSRYHDGSDKGNDINYVNGRLLYRRILIRYTNSWIGSHPDVFS